MFEKGSIRPSSPSCRGRALEARPNASSSTMALARSPKGLGQGGLRQRGAQTGAAQNPVILKPLEETALDVKICGDIVGLSDELSEASPSSWCEYPAVLSQSPLRNRAIRFLEPSSRNQRPRLLRRGFAPSLGSLRTAPLSLLINVCVSIYLHKSRIYTYTYVCVRVSMCMLLDISNTSGPGLSYLCETPACDKIDSAWVGRRPFRGSCTRLSLNASPATQAQAFGRQLYTLTREACSEAVLRAGLCLWHNEFGGYWSCDSSSSVISSSPQNGCTRNGIEAPVHVPTII